MKNKEFSVIRVTGVSFDAVCAALNKFSDTHHNAALAALLENTHGVLAVASHSWGDREVITSHVYDVSKAVIYLDWADVGPVENLRENGEPVECENYREWFTLYDEADIDYVHFASGSSGSFIRAFRHAHGGWHVECGCPIQEDGTVYRGAYWSAFQPLLAASLLEDKE